MFASTVQTLTTNGTLPQDHDWRSYHLLKSLREVEPDLFSKNGRNIVFVGTVEDIMNRKDEIVAKMRAAGYNGLIDGFKKPKNATQRVAVVTRDVKTDEKIAEIEALSDEDLFNRIQDTFSSLTLLSEAASTLNIRSMIVSGSAGTGKTYEVVKAMKARHAADRSFYYHQVKGTISPISLYIELYRARHGVLILDDADEAFLDQESLQLLKAATESCKSRTVSYRKLSMALEAEGIPQEFEFEGCVVILTNTNLEEASKSRQGHYEAIMSRAHYINAVLRTDREKIMRIRHIVTTTTMLHQFLNPEYHQEVIDFIEEHHNRFRELSIRTVVKLAELRKAFPQKWEILARGTLLV